MIGNFIKQERLNQNIKQITLSKGLCAVSHLSKIENNQVKPSNQLIKLLIERLNLDWKDLSTEEEEVFVSFVANVYKDAIQKRDQEKIREILSEITNSAYNFKSMKNYVDYSLYVFRLYLIVRQNDKISPLVTVLDSIQQQIDGKQDFIYNLNLGLVFYEEGDYSTSLLMLEKSLPSLMSLSFDEWELADFYNVLSLSYLMNNEYSNAMEYANRSLHFYRNNLLLHRAVDNNIVIGNAHKKLKNFKKAEENYLLVSNDLNLTDNVGMVNQNLGSLYSVQGEYEKAIDLFKQSYQIKVNLPGKESLLRTIFSLVKEFSKHKDKVQVLRWCTIGLEQIGDIEKVFQKTYKHHFQIYYSFHNGGEHLESLLKAAITHFTEIDHKRYLKKYLILAANIYYDHGKYKLAAQYYKDAMQLNYSENSILNWEDS